MKVSDISTSELDCLVLETKHYKIVVSRTPAYSQRPVIVTVADKRTRQAETFTLDGKDYNPT